MRYVIRDSSGGIIAHYANPQPADDGTLLTEEITEEALAAELAPTPKERRRAARAAIDAAAGGARAAFVSVGWGVEEEYRLAKAETDAWIAAGKPADAVPPSVAVWAQARGWTAEQAAQDILDTEAAWMAALAAIRQARLLGKAAVDAAADDADFDAVAGPYIAQLEAIAEQAPS